MLHRLNALGQPVGPALPDWTPRPVPGPVTLAGRYCRLEPLSAARHGDDLHAAYGAAQDDRMWTYLSTGPFPSRADLDAHLARVEAGTDARHYAIVDLADQRAKGNLALQRIDTANGSIEVGFVVYAPELQRSRIATEAQALLMGYVFDTLGYRRYEWKCDTLNQNSRNAAARLGFRFEGVFRNAIVYKGRSRDTAWFSITDADWPAVRAAFDAWLAPGNFDADGRQRQALAARAAAPADGR